MLDIKGLTKCYGEKDEPWTTSACTSRPERSTAL